MGYWEQVGVENRRHEEQRARMHPLRRAAQDFSVNVLIITVSATFWAVLIWSLMGPFLVGD